MVKKRNCVNDTFIRYCDTPFKTDIDEMKIHENLLKCDLCVINGVKSCTSSDHCLEKCEFILDYSDQKLLIIKLIGPEEAEV